MHIASVEKLQLTTTGSPILIRCKTFLSVTFVIPKERDCHNIYLTLQQLSQPSNVNELYCFIYSSNIEGIPKSAGWNFFNLQSEYQRMAVPNDHWCLTTLNKDYEVKRLVCYRFFGNFYCLLSSCVILIQSTCMYLRRLAQQYWWAALDFVLKEGYQYCLICTIIKLVFVAAANRCRDLVRDVLKMRKCLIVCWERTLTPVLCMLWTQDQRWELSEMFCIYFLISLIPD